MFTVASSSHAATVSPASLVSHLPPAIAMNIPTAQERANKAKAAIGAAPAETPLPPRPPTALPPARLSSTAAASAFVPRVHGPTTVPIPVWARQSTGPMYAPPDWALVNDRAKVRSEDVERRRVELNTRLAETRQAQRQPAQDLAAVCTEPPALESAREADVAMPFVPPDATYHPGESGYTIGAAVGDNGHCNVMGGDVM